jgi:hypothetical protein
MRYFLPIFVLCLFVGCNSNNVSVSGKVTYPDGTPVTVGQVVFDDDKFLGRAYLQPDGSYRMGRIKDGDGIPKGTYKVFLYDANIYEESPGGSSIVKPQVSAKFMDGDTSELTCTVEGKTVFNFTVERP